MQMPDVASTLLPTGSMPSAGARLVAQGAAPLTESAASLEGATSEGSVLEVASVTHTGASATAKPPRVRFEFLDGIRGLAALYVVLSHVYLWLKAQPEQSGFSSHLLSILRPLAFGRYSVDTFIVLSGFCLMLPIVRSSSGQLRGGLGGYLRRRTRRIVPPYYMALAFSLLALVVCRRFGGSHLTSVTPDYVKTSFEPGNILAHLLLLHNFEPRWIFSINSPMWSVATEWQIYFVFPLLLLPVWKRFGSVATIIMGIVAGWALYVLGGKQVFDASPWFIGLFAMGMVGAAVVMSADWPSTPRARIASERIPWLWLATATVVTLSVVGVRFPSVLSSNAPITDSVFGLAVMALLIGCARLSEQRRNSALWLRLFDSRWAVGLGAFSYSLYLTHNTALHLFEALVARLRPAPTLLALGAWLLFVPAAIGLSYLFHLAFERRFMSNPVARPEKAPALT